MLFAQAPQKNPKRKTSTKKQLPTIADVIKKSQESFSTSKKSKVETKTNDKPIKPKPSSTTVKPSSASKEGEEDFVRGAIPRAESVVPREVSEHSDVLFGVKPKPTKKLKKTEKKQERPERALKSAEESKYRPGPLMFTQMSVGVKFLASVKLILDSDLILSLPSGLTAVMSIREVSDQIAAEVDRYIESSSADTSVLPKLRDMFKVGQLLRTVVVHITAKGAGSKRRLEVSMRPSLVNRGLTKAHLRPGVTLSGSVKSVEEKGYLIDLGLNEDGFLPFNMSGSTSHYRVGHPLDVAVTNVARAIFLTTDPASLSGGLIHNDLSPDAKDQALVSMDTLLPGMLVKALWVKSDSEGGLQMRILDVLKGVVDVTHLPETIGVNEDISQLYNESTANPSGYPARVIYVDPLFKHVRLSLKPSLVTYKSPKFPADLKEGTIVKDALIVRVDDRGVTLQLAQGAVQGYAGKANIAASQREQIAKHFVTGTTCPCRVMGLQLMDGLMFVSLDPEVVNQKIFGISDLSPGQFIDGKVLKASPTEGVVVHIAPRVKGYIPITHLNDIGEGGIKKFVADATVTVRVLAISEKSGRVLLTAKKTLKNKNLPILTSFDDAVEGFITFGVVHAIKEKGLVVQFFNYVAGYLSIKELRRQHVIGPDQGTGEAYSVGQLVQVRVTNAIPSERKIFLALSLSGPTSLSTGQIVSGTVSGMVEDDGKDKVDGSKSAPRKCLMISISGHQGAMGRLESAHLTDHHHFASRLFRSYPVGTKLDSLLVLRMDAEGIVLTMKPSLLQAFAAKKLPSIFSQVAVGDLLQGYVRTITENGIFVAFLDKFIGLVPRKFISEQFVVSPFDHFQVDQSVRARVESVDPKTQHFTLNLRSSAVTVSGEEEGKLLDSYFIDRERAETQELSAKAHTAVEWKWFPIGSISKCKVLGVKEFGILGELSAIHAKSRVTCLAVRPRHMNTVLPEVGATEPCRILDQERFKLIADISFRPELLQPIPTPLKLEVGMKTPAVIQLVKEHHFVLTLPDYSHAPAVALTYTLNMRVNPHSLFRMGVQTEVTVSRVGGPYEPVRVVLDANRQLKNKRAKLTDTACEYFDRAVKRRSHLQVGRVVWVKVVKLQEHSLRVSFSNHDGNLRGQVHISEIEDLPLEPREWVNVKPLEKAAKLIGTLVKARILDVHTNEKSSFVTIDLSLRNSIMVDDGDVPQALTIFTARPGQIVPAYVISVEPESDCAWVDVSRSAKGKIVGLDFAHDRSLKALIPHTPVRCAVIGTSAGKLNLRLALDEESTIAGHTALKGTVVTCKVSQIVPGRGLNVRLTTSDGRRIWGLIHLTDITDSFPSNPLSSFQLEQYVKAYVLDEPKEVEVDTEADTETETKAETEVEPKAETRMTTSGGRRRRKNRVQTKQKTKQKQLLVHLSLRPSRVSGAIPGPNPEITLQSLTQGQIVKGYVKLTSKKGCWVSLSRDVVARVLIKNLSDKFVEDPEKEFPPGKLVSGRVTDIIDGKVDMSLKKKSSAPDVPVGSVTWKDLKEGKIVKANVTSIQKFGLFLRVLDSNVSGLCHISNVSDTPISDLEKHYKVGDLVRARITQLEPDKQRPDRYRVSFGLKTSLLQGEQDSDAEDLDKRMLNESDEEDEGDDGEGDEGDEEEEETDEEGVEDEDDDNEPLPTANDDDDVPPLPIFSFANTPASSAMEDEEEDEEDSDAEEEEESGDEGKVSTKTSRRAKASAKKRAETQLNQKEQELLDSGRTPESAEDFKRLLASSPDSSYLWIKLMAYHVGISELDKAREVAEQALKTINFREQQEKWNVWIALMNLENLYGTAESLKKVFDRAKERNDAKKITMELCKMFEASEKFTLAEEAFEATLKSFGASGKVWYNYALFFYRRKELDRARAILPRALERLVKRKHLKLIRKMAQAEYTLGTPERGRTIMEGVMSSYPKRVDLWSTYLDMEIKAGKAASFPESIKIIIRRLFERIVHLDLKPRKMKFFFKRYLSFEKDHGNAGSQHHVKELAQSYVDKVIKAA